MRGPGEYLGERQSGAPLLRFADLERDTDLLEAARGLADQLVASGSHAAARHLDVLPPQRLLHVLVNEVSNAFN